MDTDNNYNETEDHKHLFKIVLIGDAGVGKTHILSRYIKNTLPKSAMPTIGVEFATKTVKLLGGEKVKAQIWDTGFDIFFLKKLFAVKQAGQERYRSITSAHYRRAIGALVVYDVTKEKTFENVKVWIEGLKYQAEPDIVIILVGNKIDLCEKNPQMRKVTKEQGENFAAENKLLFEETSAITDQNISEAFERLLQEICTLKSKNGDNGKRNLRISSDKTGNEAGNSSCKFC